MTEAPDPGRRLPQKRDTRTRDAVVLAACGISGSGMSSIMGHPGLQIPILAGGLAGSAVYGANAARSRRRGHVRDQLVEALAPLLGSPLDRRIVRPSKWTNGWPGLPGEMLLHYNAGIADNEAWRDKVLETIRARILGRYEVVGWHRQRCVLHVKLIEDERNSERWSYLKGRPGRIIDTTPASQQRAAKALTELIGATVRVTGAEFDGEELTSITIAHQMGAKLANSGYRQRVERVLSTMMPGRWRARWDLEHDTATFELLPKLPQSVWLPADQPDDVDDLLANYSKVTIGLGVDVDGQELVWRPAISPHMLLTGGTGSGKTSLARAVIAQITQYGWPVWILDAKRIEFLDMRDWPNVQIVAGGLEQQVAMVRRVWELMEYRYSLIEKGVCRPKDFEPLVVFADEFADFRVNLLEWYAQIKVKGDPARPPTTAEFGSLLRKARTCRIHIIAALQRPDVELLGSGEARDNFGCRVSLGRLLSAQAAIMVWGDPTVGVTVPRGIIGRGTASRPDGTPVEMQSFRFPDPDADPDSDEGQLIGQLRPAQARHPRLVIVPPEEGVDLDGNVIVPTFRDYARADWALATDRPDLDPLQQPLPSEDEGRLMASNLSALGLDHPGTTHGGEQAVEHHRPQLRLLHQQDVDPDDTSTYTDLDEAYADELEDDEYAGYGEPEPASVGELMVGDLIEADPDSGIWVVVDEAPEDDPLAPGLMAVSWRGDGDEAGSISIPQNQALRVRRARDE